MRTVRVYVGCALTHAPEEYKKQIASFKDTLRNIPWITVLDFWNAAKGNGLDPDPEGIYHTDIYECVGTADAIVGELTHPSIGLGWELGTSIEKHRIRAFMMAKEVATVSNLPIGSALHSRNLHVSIHRYKEEMNELLPLILQELQVVWKRKNAPYPLKVVRKIKECWKRMIA